MRRRLVYLAGPVTGRPHRNEAAFAQAQHLAERAGFVTCNPLLIVPPSASWLGAMVRCLWHLTLCDAVQLLPEWEQSRGARLERAWAQVLGLPVSETLDALEESLTPDVRLVS